MWPFIKKKSVFISRDQSKRSYICTPAIVEACLFILMGNGAFFSLFYANMCGYERETIDYDNLFEFKKLIESKPLFTPSGMEYAVKRLTRDTDSVFRSEVFDLQFYGVDGKKNITSREYLEALRRDIKMVNFNVLCDDIGFDVEDFLISNALARREHDLEIVIAKLEEKKEYLKPILLRSRAKAKNKYGDSDRSEYWNDVMDFMNHYFPEGSLIFFYHLKPFAFATDYLERWFDEPEDESIMPIDGRDFEYWCAVQLEKLGWSVTVTKSTGDQGVDVVANGYGKVIVVQCKRYTSPVGNKAVQEAFAGKALYQADAACVIATGGFTSSAIELSNNTGVILLDAENIGQFNYFLIQSR